MWFSSKALLMNRFIILFKFVFLSLGVISCAQADTVGQEKNCQLDNADLQAMPLIDVIFKGDHNHVFTTKARLADNAETRAAGFQKVCASTIAATPILFIFNAEFKPKFHMNNVVAAIDIAFIDKNGRIESIQAMKPYSMMAIKKPLYSPNRPVVAAFEAHPGFFKKHSISYSSQFSWSKPKPSE